MDPIYFQILGLLWNVLDIGPNLQTLASQVVSCVLPALLAFQLRNYFEGISTEKNLNAYSLGCF